MRLTLVLCLVASDEMNRTHTQQYHCFTHTLFKLQMVHFISHMNRARLWHGNEAEVGLSYLCVLISFKCASKSTKHLLNSISAWQISFIYFCVVYPVIYITGHMTRTFKIAFLHDRQLWGCTTRHSNPL